VTHHIRVLTCDDLWLGGNYRPSTGEIWQDGFVTGYAATEQEAIALITFGICSPMAAL
jgi:hypothetical protein